MRRRHDATDSMREHPRRAMTLAAAGLLALAPLGLGLGIVLAPDTPARADDEPRGLGRLFRFGNRRDPAPSTPPARGDRSREPADEADQAKPAHNHPVTPSPFRPGAAASGAGSAMGAGSLSPYRSSTGNPYGSGNLYSGPPSPLGPDQPIPSGPGYSTTPPPAFAGGAGNPANNRIVPQPRVSRASTEAEPILSRVSIGRSDDGRHFGMFIQVYADGTIIDSEGVHKVGPDVLRPLIEALRAAEVGRERPHCGGPPTDFIEQVYLTVYDRSRGRLQANHLTFSGNTQGCDAPLRNLQAAIDAVQSQVASPPTSASAASSTPNQPLGLAPAPGLGTDSAPTPPLAPPSAPVGNPTPISLTPIP